MEIETNDNMLANDIEENKNVELETQIYETKLRSKRDIARRKTRREINNLKGFSRKGIFGRGTQLEPGQGSYFVSLCDRIREPFETIEDKEIFANNGLETCLENEVKYSANQISCRVIENLIGFTNEEIFEKFIKAFQSDFRPLCTDRFSSHVLQKVIEIAFLRSCSKLQPKTADENVSGKKLKLDLFNDIDYNITNNFSEKHIIECGEFVKKASNFLLNNLEDFFTDPYANYLIRSSLANVTGICIKKENSNYANNKKVNETQNERFVVPDDWKEITLEYADRLLLWPQLCEFPYNEYTSGILQALLTALKLCDKNKLKSFGKKLISTSMNIEGNANEGKLPKVFTTEPSVRLLESMLKLAGNKLQIKIYNTLFANRLKSLSEMKSCNFAVQKLMEYIKDEKHYEMIFDELSTNIENLLHIGYTGVVLSMVQACVRLKTRQAAFMKALQTALHCIDPQERNDLFPLLVLKLKPYEIYLEDNSNFIHTHGSLILQAMLNFNKPINIVHNLLNTKNEIIANVFCTPAGSHVANAFVSSHTVGEKSREKIIRHMQGTYFDMVMSRNGSHAFEALFNAAGDKQKEYLMGELSKKSGLLSGSQSGKIISMKYRLHVFSTCPTRWKSEFNMKNKAQKMFNDVIN